MTHLTFTAGTPKFYGTGSLKRVMRKRERLVHVSKTLEVKRIDAGGGLYLEQLVVSHAPGWKPKKPHGPDNNGRTFRCGYPPGQRTVCRNLLHMIAKHPARYTRAKSEAFA